MRRRIFHSRSVRGVLVLLACLTGTVAGSAEAPENAAAAFDAYANAVEGRLALQHRSGPGFLGGMGSRGEKDARLRRGELILENLSPRADDQPKNALLHHWRGTAFVCGATASDFERVMRDIAEYPQRFAPQIVRAAIQPDRDPDHFAATMRMRQRHVITVVMDTTFDIRYGRLDAQHGCSISRSTKISEISSPGKRDEQELPASDEHGFLWRLNTYWSWEERDGGLYIQVESISLTREIPMGLGWMVRPYVESVPRESLEFTLRATCKALEK